ncbi:hypothetical protein ACFV2X_50030 [Streptomyces sp. NPDC059679]|uniref:hypothetical protein n=1 Tax=Streptomyces sp. NPDC059679 TaxID=3346903 RepID=UPI00367F3E64
MQAQAQATRRFDHELKQQYSGYGAYVQINGEEQHHPGTALLLTAAPAGKGRLLDTSGLVPALAAVAPSAWSGTAATTLIELTDPTDPQAVLTRIQFATAAPDPLTIVLVGQLQLDRRQQSIHVALARSTPSTLRYTGLPWTWFVQQLQQRRPDTTTVYVDLVADAEVWQLLLDEPLDLGHARAFGIIAPPAGRRRTAQPRYTQALAQTLRTGHRPRAEQLHQEALRRIDTEGAIVLGPEHSTAAPHTALEARKPAPQALIPGSGALPSKVIPPQSQRAVSPVYVPSTAVVPIVDDPHERIAAAAQAGRHREAAQLAAAAEQHALQLFGPGTYPAVHWIEVRAFIASVAQDHVISCELWLAAAEARLDALQQDPDTPDVETAADGAHHQWERIRDAAHARQLAPRLVELRRRVPGGQHGALAAIQKKLSHLQAV